MLKKMVLLAVMGLAVLAVAGPASASAYTAEWTESEKALEAEATVEFTGNAKFDTGTSSVECTIHVITHLAPNSGTGSVTFSVTPSTCVIGGELGAVCTAVTGVDVPQAFMADAESNGTIKISEIRFIDTFSGEPGCPPALEVTGSNVTATPDSTTGMNTVTLSGTVNVTGVGTATVSSSALSVSPAGVFGFE